MAKIRITKEFHFEMAHALWNYDGLCKNIHGHGYILQVTVKGEPNADKNDPKYGMVMDFGELKKIVEDAIIKKIDHSLVISRYSKYQPLLQTEQMFERIHITEYQPTCENLVIAFVSVLQKLLPDTVQLYRLTLWETSSSCSEWCMDDNEK